MMRRLRDETDSSDPTLARAAALLASRPPLDTDRMWGRALPPLEPARRRGPVLRVGLVLAISFASVVAGAATALPQGNWWAAPWTVVHALIGTSTGTSSPRLAPSHTASAGDAHGAAVSPALPVVEPASESPSRMALPAPEPAAAAPLITPTASGHAAAGNRASAQARAATDSARNANDGESALMLDAVRALRRDHNPGRALALAETALDRYPHGAQVEEAMALGMEAASAAGDGARARRLAERYLASFRAGRFTDRAQQIVGASSH